MARLPHPDVDSPDLAPLTARIRAERGGKMLNLYRMLLHSPPVADGWRALLTAIRQQCKLSGRVRELVTMRVAVLNGADYEWNAHVPFARAEKITDAQMEDLRAGRYDSFDGRERAALEYTDVMTQAIRVPDPIFASVRKHFDERELVELTATVATYNMVSRFLTALQVDPERHD